MFDLPYAKCSKLLTLRGSNNAQTKKVSRKYLCKYKYKRVLLHKYALHTDGSTGWWGASNGLHELHLNELNATCLTPLGMGVLSPHYHVSKTSEGSNYQGTGQPLLPDLVCKGRRRQTPQGEPLCTIWGRPAGIRTKHRNSPTASISRQDQTHAFEA